MQNQQWNNVSGLPGTNLAPNSSFFLTSVLGLSANWILELITYSHSDKLDNLKSFDFFVDVTKAWLSWWKCFTGYLFRQCFCGYIDRYRSLCQEHRQIHVYGQERNLSTSIFLRIKKFSHPRFMAKSQNT